MHEFFYRVFLAFINPLYPLFMLYGIDEWIDQRSVGVIGAYSQAWSEASSSRGWTVQSSCSNVARISDDMALPDSAVLILILRRGEGRAEDARRLLSVWPGETSYKSKSDISQGESRLGKWGELGPDV